MYDSDTWSALWDRKKIPLKNLLNFSRILSIKEKAEKNPVWNKSNPQRLAWLPPFYNLVSCSWTLYFCVSLKYSYTWFLPNFPSGKSDYYSWRFISVLFYHLSKYLGIKTLNSLEHYLLLIRACPCQSAPKSCSCLAGARDMTTWVRTNYFTPFCFFWSLCITMWCTVTAVSLFKTCSHFSEYCKSLG